MKRVLLYGTVGGVLIVLLRVLEYQHFVRTVSSGVYGGLIAVVFTGVGIYLGLRWARRREVVVVREVPARAEFMRDEAKASAIGLTPRELEVLGLIAQGLSNREIGERLFVAENTVKTHASRVFEKLGVKRRVQAVQAAREQGLVP
ncbi:response regulator transcription factor [Acidobacteria bacterium ACD]|nr:MAG: DNA-binding response regulator [Acidobacteriota bacterium]MCE7958141.1 DNA-binding response regulator [Acidobacteria bacterium ACB2]MDL1950414.1 response regulator transcription factor [Acidobacteria bacterium ACD]